MAWLRLIRWKNLLIIFLTQLLAWWSVVLPETSAYYHDTSLFHDVSNFFLLSISTVLIAAAGYIINDYFDIKIDLINRPDRVVLGKTITGRAAILSHAILNIIALLLAGIVATRAHHYEWPLLQLGCVLLLWRYSTHFKRQYMTGNLAVALLTALTIIVLIVYEPVLYLLPRHTIGSLSSLPVWILAVYAYFAFMLTWMREIVKDMEDYKGDEAEGCETMPIRRGLKYATNFTKTLSVLALLPLIAAASMLFVYHYYLLAIYVIALLAVPLIIWSVFLGKDITAQHYHKTSRGLKIIMLLGIFSLLIYHFQINVYSAG